MLVAAQNYVAYYLRFRTDDGLLKSSYCLPRHQSDRTCIIALTALGPPWWLKARIEDISHDRRRLKLEMLVEVRFAECNSHKWQVHTGPSRLAKELWCISADSHHSFLYNRFTHGMVRKHCIFCASPRIRVNRWVSIAKRELITVLRRPGSMAVSTCSTHLPHAV